MRPKDDASIGQKRCRDGITPLTRRLGEEWAERLIAAANALERATHLIVLLGGDAGLRCGEMMALEWRDVDLH